MRAGYDYPIESVEWFIKCAECGWESDECHSKYDDALDFAPSSCPNCHTDDIYVTKE